MPQCFPNTITTATKRIMTSKKCYFLFRIKFRHPDKSCTAGTVLHLKSRPRVGRDKKTTAQETE
jgi:hypothetical protein